MLRGRLPYGPMGEDSPEVVAALGNTQAVGIRLYTDYLFPFEVTSLILLVGIIGAVVLAMRRSGWSPRAPSRARRSRPRRRPRRLARPPSSASR
jgi:hypothetical protein